MHSRSCDIFLLLTTPFMHIIFDIYISNTSYNMYMHRMLFDMRLLYRAPQKEAGTSCTACRRYAHDY